MEKLIGFVVFVVVFLLVAKLAHFLLYTASDNIYDDETVKRMYAGGKFWPFLGQVFLFELLIGAVFFALILIISAIF